MDGLKYIFLSTDDGKILVVSLDKKINEGTIPKK